MGINVKNILVGGTGFIGSELAVLLSRKGESVLSIARHKTALPMGVSELLLDVSDHEAVEKTFPRGETVYILIGQNSPQFDEEKELWALKNLVAVLNRTRPKRVLYLSSALVYGETDASASESLLCNPLDRYSRFKCVAEELLQSGLNKDIRLGILRLANVYGGKKNRGFIGLILAHLAQEKKDEFIVNGDGLQERDYIFTDDAVSAIVAVASGLNQSDTVNIATGKSHTLLDVLAEVSRATGRNFPYGKNGKKPMEAGRCRVSNEKLRIQYGFSPEHSLREGICETIRRSIKTPPTVFGLRMLLLGGEGFIGRNLAAYFSSANECLSVSPRQSIFLDRRDKFMQADPYRDEIDGQYDVIIHLVDNKIPLNEFEEAERNLMAHLSLKKNGHLIVFSSAVVYANPNSDYGKRKQLLENFYTKYCNEHGISLTILRLFNTFGPYQVPYRQGSLVSNLIYNALNGIETRINDGEATRDFLYSGDVPKFVEYVIVNELEGIRDVGSGRLLSVRELIFLLGGQVLNEPLKVSYQAIRDIRETTLDRCAEGELIGRINLTALTEGCKKTMSFYEDNLPTVRNYVGRKV